MLSESGLIYYCRNTFEASVPCSLKALLPTRQTWGCIPKPVTSFHGSTAEFIKMRKLFTQIGNNLQCRWYQVREKDVIHTQVRGFQSRAAEECRSRSGCHHAVTVLLRTWWNKHSSSLNSRRLDMKQWQWLAIQNDKHLLGTDSSHLSLSGASVLHDLMSWRRH